MTAPQYPGFDFKITHKDTGSAARCGIISTPHGEIRTPNFIFCATRGAIKSATIFDVKNTDADIILSNTYHLMLRPGADHMLKMGGIHQFIGWDKPMLTDSGGFQIFSLGQGGSVANEIKGSKASKYPETLMKITEKGARFKSYIDGAYWELTPESSIQIQKKIGADFILMLDECTPFNVSREYTQASMEMSHRWGDRSLKEFVEGESYFPQALVGISQGGIYPELRKVSGEYISDRPFFSHAIGGSLGSDKAQMYDVVGYAQESRDQSRAVHLLGIGGVDDIWHNVAQGIDTFDCVSPTRIARHGWALSRENRNYRLNLRNARFREDRSPISEDCACPVCQTYDRAYLHYLLKAGEMSVANLITIHNMHFMMDLMQTVRDSIQNGTFEQEKRRWLDL